MHVRILDLDVRTEVDDDDLPSPDDVLIQDINDVMQIRLDPGENGVYPELIMSLSEDLFIPTMETKVNSLPYYLDMIQGSYKILDITPERDGISLNVIFNEEDAI